MTKIWRAEGIKDVDRAVEGADNKDKDFLNDPALENDGIYK